MPAWYRTASPPPAALGAGAAIGILELGGDVTTALARLGLGEAVIGEVRRRGWPGVDSVVVARVAPASVLVFPHGGRAVLARALHALADAGIEPRTDLPAAEGYPEARTLVEARMLAALARAESPLAIDLLLDQPRRWAVAERDATARLPAGESAPLRRLIDPALVVLLGAPNIGKSSLLNALAGRGVSIVADVPGTTRDHVGVTLDLAGVVVRCIDTPGIGADGIGAGEQAELDRAAQELALQVAATADLLVLCADASTAETSFPALAGRLGGVPAVRAVLRADLAPDRAGRPPTAGHDRIAVSVHAGTGLEALTWAVRDALVPLDLLSDPRAWEFWDHG